MTAATISTTTTIIGNVGNVWLDAFVGMAVGDVEVVWLGVCEDDTIVSIITLKSEIWLTNCGVLSEGVAWKKE